MVVVQAEWFAGRSTAQKEALVAEITGTPKRIGGAQQERGSGDLGFPTVSRRTTGKHGPACPYRSTVDRRQNTRRSVGGC
jgi:hypothetical protein